MGGTEVKSRWVPVGLIGPHPSASYTCIIVSSCFLGCAQVLCGLVRSRSCDPATSTLAQRAADHMRTTRPQYHRTLAQHGASVKDRSDFEPSNDAMGMGVVDAEGASGGSAL